MVVTFNCINPITGFTQSITCCTQCCTYSGSTTNATCCDVSCYADFFWAWWILIGVGICCVIACKIAIIVGCVMYFRNRNRRRQQQLQ